MNLFLAPPLDASKSPANGVHHAQWQCREGSGLDQLTGQRQAVTKGDPVKGPDRVEHDVLTHH